MKMTQMKKAFRFTLVELLVAMGVFIVLLTLLLQFFSGAQKIWTGMEKKNNLYADARVAMDLMTNLLQSTVAFKYAVPFVIPANGGSEVYFVAKSPIDLGGSTEDLKLVSFRLNNNTLKLLAFSDPNWTNSQFRECFQVHLSGGNTPELTTAEQNMKGLLTIPSSGTVNPGAGGGLLCQDILENVTDFKMLPVDAPAASNNAPKAVVVQVSLMDKRSFDTWKNDMRGDQPSPSQVSKDFRQQHEYTFSRVVYLNDVMETVN